eukprot:CAMPEP_0194264692 /NCGR_PEP_ID=MMETSP0158-20130606/47718_1 /TAXON_ID=33649 /ORGANISM="Thalassionema nitzschioides, Strain L26-B" /LENGTH=150 /DNA_ID=CAMNT_0039004941 /DNA_START=198 /DNA_END=650 /DNA_ORIENTATION=-
MTNTFLFSYSKHGGIQIHTLTTDNGCLTVNSFSPQDDDKVILGNCKSKIMQSWGFDFQGWVHPLLNPDLCLQAGRGGKLHHGTKVRLHHCDPHKKALQTFELDPRGRLTLMHNTTATDLCVDHRGIRSNRDLDPIILKDCAVAGVWEVLK